MPFKGFICAATRRPVSVADCLAHARADESALPELGCHLTAALLRVVADALKEEDLDANAIRVTQLLGCPREAAWKKSRDYWITPQQAYWFWRGQLFHAGIERGKGTRDVVERRFKLDVKLGDGTIITGKPDAIVPIPTDAPTRQRKKSCCAPYRLVDYKSTERVPSEPKPQHVQQLNVYRWLVADCLRAVENIEIADEGDLVYLTMTKIARMRVQLVSVAETDAFVCERIKLFQAATPAPDWRMCAYCAFARECDTSRAKEVADAS